MSRNVWVVLLIFFGRWFGKYVLRPRLLISVYTLADDIKMCYFPYPNPSSKSPALETQMDADIKED